MMGVDKMKMWCSRNVVCNEDSVGLSNSLIFICVPNLMQSTHYFLTVLSLLVDETQRECGMPIRAVCAIRKLKSLFFYIIFCFTGCKEFLPSSLVVQRHCDSDCAGGVRWRNFAWAELFAPQTASFRRCSVVVEIKDRRLESKDQRSTSPFADRRTRRKRAMMSGRARADTRRGDTNGIAARVSIVKQGKRHRKYIKQKTLEGAGRLHGRFGFRMGQNSAELFLNIIACTIVTI